MKKLTSLVAMFLICFGMATQAQTIESIGQNITDLAQLTNDSYVLLKNVKADKFVSVDAKNVLMLGDQPAVGAGTEYLWKVSVNAGNGKVAFFDANGCLIGKPNFKKPGTPIKTVNKSGAWFNVQPYGTTANWQLYIEWTTYNTPKQMVLASDKKGNIIGEKEVASPSVAAQFEIIPVTVTKSADQIAVEEILKAWTGLEKHAGGLPESVLKELSKCTTKAQAEELVNNAVKNPIEADEYFQMINVKNGKALTVVDGLLSSVEPSIFEAGQLWKLTQTAEGQYSFLQANHNEYLQLPGNSNLGATAVVMDVTSLDKAQWSLSAAGKYMSVNADGEFVAAPDVTAEGAQWYLLPKKDLRIKLNPITDAEGIVLEGWASVYLPFNATCGNIAAGIEYYGVSAAGNGVARLQATDGIQAGKGILLHHQGTQLDFGFKIGKNAKNTEDQVWNILQGTYIDQPKTANSLVLGNGAQGVGLYHPSADNLKANKAYLDHVAAASGLKFVFGEATGVENVETTISTDNIYYDLSGRRVASPVKGIYIRNGKKVFIGK